MSDEEPNPVNWEDSPQTRSEKPDTICKIIIGKNVTYPQDKPVAVNPIGRQIRKKDALREYFFHGDGIIDGTDWGLDEETRQKIVEAGGTTL
ncbi:hypothetical protein H6775_03020 [Candidatus Nomurabacteria bacterium]|nr:hypothetical protein [Candidatus Nomurabacteria bacterium]